MRYPLRPLFLVSIAVLVAACGSAAPTTTPAPPVATAARGTAGASAAPLAGDATQTSERAGVTVAVTWVGPSAGAVFEVTLDNHMIDLASVDLSAATLTNDRGERLSRPTWEGGPSGHHRDGKLSFGTASAAFFADAGWVELELPAVGDSSPRDFKWALSR